LTAALQLLVNGLYVAVVLELAHDKGNTIIILTFAGITKGLGFTVNLYSATAATNELLLETEHVIYIAYVYNRALLVKSINTAVI
jgi:hypothetical protein